jgi:hypothetical protein
VKHRHDEFEREFARRLADAINVRRHTSYRAIEIVDQEFPDFRLSGAAGDETLDVEVVTVPIGDFTARRDTGVQKKLRTRLKQEFNGEPGLVIQVGLRDKGLLHHLDEGTFVELARAIRTLISERDPARGFARKKIEWDGRTKLSEYVYYLCLHTLPSRHPTPHIWFPLCHWVPQDCGWIHEGIQHKLCYGSSVIENSVLVVGDLAEFGERNIVEKCRDDGEFSRYAFKEIWFASHFFPIPGIIRLK